MLISQYITPWQGGSSGVSLLEVYAAAQDSLTSEYLVGHAYNYSAFGKTYVWRITHIPFLP
jgi:hypothetical protein